MNPVKLLASRNILMMSAVFAVVFVAFVLLKSPNIESAQTMPAAELFSVPPAPTDPVVPLDTLLAAYRQSRATALRKYQHAPFATHVDTVTPIDMNGWAEAVTVGGGRATLYFTANQGSDPTIAAGSPGTFICADWQAGPSGTVLMFGCGAIPTP